MRRPLALLLATVACTIFGAAWADPTSSAPSSRPATRLVHGRSRIRPVELFPTTAAGLRLSNALAAASAPATGGPLELGPWSYRIEKTGPDEGVTWRLIATPLSELAERLAPAAHFKPPERILEVPVTRVPEQLWPQWFEESMKDVVGIHYHQFLADGVADVLLTIHKVPADGPDGKPPAKYAGKRGTRLEATLLRPLAYHLDQTILVRGAGPADKDQSIADKRVAHERGHGELSLNTLVATLAGPQNWNVKDCTGRRATMAWYWATRKVGRRWDGYRGGNGEVSTLRTTIVLVPPTRWSMMVPLEPDEVSQKQIQEFNDSIVHLHVLYAEVDARAQKKFHESHGDYEASP